jgi:hypothetical protein
MLSAFGRLLFQSAEAHSYRPAVHRMVTGVFFMLVTEGGPGLRPGLGPSPFGHRADPAH